MTVALALEFHLWNTFTSSRLLFQQVRVNGIKSIKQKFFPKKAKNFDTFLTLLSIIGLNVCLLWHCHIFNYPSPPPVFSDSIIYRHFWHILSQYFCKILTFQNLEKQIVSAILVCISFSVWQPCEVHFFHEFVCVWTDRRQIEISQTKESYTPYAWNCYLPVSTLARCEK